VVCRRAVSRGPLVRDLWDFWPCQLVIAMGNVPGMSIESQPVSILSESECWNLLSSVALGRLVTSVDGHPAIFPVNFVVQHRTVLFRTSEGTKLVSAAINNQVLFEADDHGVTEGWSVIVKGTARILRTHEEIDEAERAQLLPWIATVKQHFVRIRPLSVTGRRFVFGSEPDREFDAV
jgi:nitroimidazol reductase NimA-like FMN-containing flavoprotein (pyridoxamine 5'-phosphate oxidase superfamily)